MEIIDSDLSGSRVRPWTSARREGFERVLSAVALGEVGIVGSRGGVTTVANRQEDWCRLLEVCQIFGTLIADR